MMRGEEERRILNKGKGSFYTKFFFYLGFLIAICMVSFIHSIGPQIEKQLKKAPQDPSFLFEDSYLPEMNSISKKELKKLSKPTIPEDTEAAATTEPSYSEGDTTEKIKTKTKIPGITQIILISLFVLILIIYRFRVGRREAR